MSINPLNVKKQQYFQDYVSNHNVNKNTGAKINN